VELTTWEVRLYLSDPCDDRFMLETVLLTVDADPPRQWELTLPSGRRLVLSCNGWGLWDDGEGPRHGRVSYVREALWFARFGAPRDAMGTLERRRYQHELDGEAWP
jgi:hypothetical protein